MKSASMTIQMKATEQYFAVVLFIMLFRHFPKVLCIVIIIIIIIIML